MEEHPITHADVELVANRLDDLRDQLTDREYATLQVVFRLAGSGATHEGQPAEPPEVEGFKLTPDKTESGNEHVRRGELFAQFSSAFALTPAMPSPVPLPYPNIR